MEKIIIFLLKPKARHWSKFLTLKLASLLIATLCYSGVAHASDIGVLRIQNNSNATQTFIVIDDYFDCMDFPKPAIDGKRTTIIVPAFSKTDTQFAKDGRCEGKQGRFLIMPLDRSTGQAFGHAMAFHTDTGANLERIWENQSLTPHAVGLESIGKDFTSGKKTFVLTTNLKGYDIQNPTGKWVFGCGGSQGCTKKLSSAVENTISKEESTSKEVMNAFSMTVSIGFEFEGISGGAEMTSSSSTTTSEALTLASSGMTGIGEECEIPTDMEKYQIYSVWQWVIEAYVGTDRVSTKTCQVTCTPTGAAPKFLPGAPEAINACLIPRTSASELAAIEMAKTERERPKNCATLYTGVNGTGKKLTLCEQDHNWKEYTNLGSTGVNKHSHHYALKSIKCGSNIHHLTFTNGNIRPSPTKDMACNGNNIVNSGEWVTKNGTGVGVYK